MMGRFLSGLAVMVVLCLATVFLLHATGVHLPDPVYVLIGIGCGWSARRIAKWITP